MANHERSIARFLALAIACCASMSVGEAAAAPARTKDIVDTAVAAGSFKTLAKALAAADLVDVLKSPGPFTVFAPTDEAFAKLPGGTVASLLKPANRSKLVAILTYHVVAGRVEASQVLGSAKLDTVQGASLLVSKGRGGARVDAAKIAKTDVRASNGVIHVIDSVLLPKDIVKTAEVAGQFKTLLAAAKAAGLVAALKAEGPLTIFAPTDKAFADLPDGTVEDLLLPENRDRLAAILTYHVVPRRLLLGQPEAKTLQGGSLDIRPAGSFRVDEATVALANVRATNGVVHVIDRVLLPDLPEPTPARKAMAVIELAIERGAPLYNAGKPEACAAIYEVAARSLLDGFSDVISEQSSKRLRGALKAIRQDHRARSQAWTLRHALDDVYRSLRGRKH
jgi:transforming growth factor-beta-induced protein